MFNKVLSASTAMLLLAAGAVHSQILLNGNLGWPEWPSGSTPIDSLPYQGENGDMSGGYQIGETVADFTVYDFEGNPLTLSEKLAGNKPVILLSGSVTCNRFRDMFDPSMVSQENLISRTFMFDNIDNFEWIFIYNVEAHPSDGWCPSNCYNSAQLDTSVLQHPDYHYRRFAMRDWMESPLHDFPFDMYADNPDNSVYDTFFRRPSGTIILNCQGEVLMRGDWTQLFLPSVSDQILALLDTPFQTCITDEEEGENSNSIAETDKSNMLNVFPNPADESFQLNVAESGIITLYDVAGRSVHSQRVMTGTGSFVISGLSRGTYTGVLLSDSGLISRFRIVKN